jgi:hypothetical protein
MMPTASCYSFTNESLRLPSLTYFGCLPIAFLFPLAPALCLCGPLLLSTNVNLGSDDPDRYEVLSQRPPSCQPISATVETRHFVKAGGKADLPPGITDPA